MSHAAYVARQGQLSVRELAIQVVQHFIDGRRILAIGGLVYAQGEGYDNMPVLMNTSKAVQVRDCLNKMGIAMVRVDAGGSPEWHFHVFNTSPA
jgi:hypothetical protein